MKKVLLWCRDLDSLIGYSHSIPWHISSDLKRFKNVTKGGWVLAGRTTYESFPNRTLPNRKIIVLTSDKNYQVSDPENHFTINSFHQIPEKWDIDVLYIAGGAKIYKTVMEGENLRPEYIIDSVYQKKHPELHQEGVFIPKETIEILENNYQADFINEVDEVKTYLCCQQVQELQNSPFYNQLKTRIKEIE